MRTKLFIKNMIQNINYKGNVSESVVKTLVFSKGKPQQFVDKKGKYTIIIFRSGKCRIMGCKKPLKKKYLQYPINDIVLQSSTLTVDLGEKVNLYKVAKVLNRLAMFEPEIFPALRYLKYNPLCVNIFSSGKVVILGVKQIKSHALLSEIVSDIKCVLATI
mgnify:FL=1